MRADSEARRKVQAKASLYPILCASCPSSTTRLFLKSLFVVSLFVSGIQPLSAISIKELCSLALNKAGLRKAIEPTSETSDARRNSSLPYSVQELQRSVAELAQDHTLLDLSTLDEAGGSKNLGMNSGLDNKKSLAQAILLARQAAREKIPRYIHAFTEAHALNEKNQSPLDVYNAAKNNLNKKALSFVKDHIAAGKAIDEAFIRSLDPLLDSQP